ncbi:PREDICTED: protein yellow-like [Nicrophorus vespilloides]|uniref:Protein yellow-like n=1 Tax=Nicrophorus vespilloides TaxID=110193 RepID=A0ABM1N6U3_NICVS|nr:PREDICTED: protein yellow-like [Nicrophorus vespilloides]
MQPPRFNICDYLGFLLVSYCVAPDEEVRIQKRTSEGFEVDYQWTYINFTWDTPEDYKDAVLNKKYIPQNNAMGGVKFYNDRVYIALPRLRTGTPVTLAYVTPQRNAKTNLLLTPYPSWNMNVQNSCGTLQNVQSMEIDRRGIMWVLDGVRINTFTSCPPKLVLLDLNNNGKVLHSYSFHNEISMRQGGYLNDLVVEESGGGFAYITDSSALDPGLVVYSRRQGRAWKLRDKTMFAEFDAANFTVDGVSVVGFIGVDGIALSPPPKHRDEERLIYFTALNGYSIYALSNKILKNEAYCKTDQWRRFVKYVGDKSSQSGGMIMDNKGNLFYGLLGTYSIAKWNIFEPFSTVKHIYHDEKQLIWPDSFGMDSTGNLYVLTNGIIKFFDTSYPLTLNGKIKFRILKTYTGNKNYMFSGK